MHQLMRYQIKRITWQRRTADQRDRLCVERVPTAETVRPQRGQYCRRPLRVINPQEPLEQPEVARVANLLFVKQRMARGVAQPLVRNNPKLRQRLQTQFAFLRDNLPQIPNPDQFRLAERIEESLQIPLRRLRAENRHRRAVGQQPRIGAAPNLLGDHRLMLLVQHIRQPLRGNPGPQRPFQRNRLIAPLHRRPRATVHAQANQPDQRNRRSRQPNPHASPRTRKPTALTQSKPQSAHQPGAASISSIENTTRSAKAGSSDTTNHTMRA